MSEHTHISTLRGTFTLCGRLVSRVALAWGEHNATCPDCCKLTDEANNGTTTRTIAAKIEAPDAGGEGT